MRVGHGTTRSIRPRVTAEERQRILAMRAQGMNMVAISRETGRDDRTIRRVLRQARLVA